MSFVDDLKFLKVVNILSIKYAAASAVSGTVVLLMCCADFTGDLNVNVGDLLLGSFCAIAILFSIVGVIAAVRKKTWLIWTCSVVLIIMTIINIAIVFSMYTNLNINTHHMAKSYMKDARIAMDDPDMSHIYIKYRCCGMDNPREFRDEKLDVPHACYDPTSLKMFYQPCTIGINDKLRRNQIAMIGTQSINILIEIFGAIVLTMISTGFTEELDVDAGNIILGTLGAVAALFSIIAIIAVLQQKIWLIWMCSVALIIVIIINIAIVFSMYTNLNINAEKAAKYYLFELAKDPDVPNIHTKYRCCGIYGPKDYLEYEFDIPLSCFDETNLKLFYQPCMTAMSNDLRRNQIVMITTQSISILIEFIASVFSVILGTSFMFGEEELK